MNPSANTLFHFTSSFNALKGILKNGFYLSYCLEGNYAFPMISLCDLPLSLSKTQFEKYGGYAIGLKIKWGVKNNFNPVLYITENSSLNEQMLLSYELVDFVKKGKLFVLPNHAREFAKIVFSGPAVWRYKKPFIGTLKRGRKTFKDYKYYNEREWRYLPDVYNESIVQALTRSEFNKYKIKNPTKPHLKAGGIPVIASDIKYVIVKTELERKKLIQYLRSMKEIGTNTAKDILASKILTSEGIMEDM